jgi:hypothetical protein
MECRRVPKKEQGRRLEVRREEGEIAMRSRHVVLTVCSPLLLVALVLLACGGLGGPGGASSAPPTPTPTFTPTTPPDPSAAVRLNAAAGETVGGVHLQIYGHGAYLNTVFTYPQLGFTCGPHLVLAAARPAATSASDVQAIRSYASGALQVTREGYPIPGAPPPAALRWVAGSTSCVAELQLSNVGGTPLQITQAGIRLAAAVEPNGYRYAQLDVCSVDLQRFPCGNGGGAGACAATTPTSPWARAPSAPSTPSA